MLAACQSVAPPALSPAPTPAVEPLTPAPPRRAAALAHRAGAVWRRGVLVSPMPVRVARRLGADVVIAVDISNKPAYGTESCVHIREEVGEALTGVGAGRV